MILHIHRGTNEIGGSCVEIEQGGFRLLLDFGQPLVGPGSDIGGKLKGKRAAELVADGVLPDIPGLYDGVGAGKIAIVFSHVHKDHTGFLKYVHPDIPIWMTQGTHALLSASSVYFRDSYIPPHVSILPGKKASVKIGPFTITPYVVDHSAPDAVALLVEEGGKRILYSGDFRRTGRKGGLFFKLLKDAPRSVDALILEGTMFGRTGEQPKREVDLEDEIRTLLKERQNLLFLFASGQNYDRMVTAYRAARSTGSLFVIDLYYAWMLKHIAESCSPSAGFFQNEDVRIWDWGAHRSRLLKAHQETFVEEMLLKRIDKKELIANRQRILFATQTSRQIERIIPWMPEEETVRLLWSMWSGYLDDDTHIEMLQKKFGNQLIHIHTSGHASVADLKLYVELLQPKRVIPIHTFHAEEYPSHFENVVQLKDGEALEI